jgi:plastocyanin
MTIFILTGYKTGRNILTVKEFVMRKLIFTLFSGTILSLSGLLASASAAFAATNTTTAPSARLAAASSQSVTIQNFAFSPASITVAPGTTVTWTNMDSTAHTVTADSGTGPNSGQLANGQTYKFTYQQTGTFAYHCSIHPQMHGTVTVASSSQPASGQTQGGMGGGSSSQQQQTQTAPAPSPTQTTPSGGMGGMVAAGPVAAGSGSTAARNHDNGALIISILSFATAAALLFVRRLPLTKR